MLPVAMFRPDAFAYPSPPSHLRGEPIEEIPLGAIRKSSAAARPANSPFELSLRIRHPSMKPTDLSRELGLEAKYSFCAGEPRESRGPYISSGSVYGESYWLGSLDATVSPVDPWLSDLDKAATRSLGSAIALGAVRFLRSKAALLERLHKEGGEVSLLVSLSPSAVGSFSLSPEVTRTFGELKITAEFEMADE
jgi:hypothetical protein